MSMDHIRKAKVFADLHCKGDPLVLTNVWDAGSARAVEKAGAKALATGSASLAMSQGFEDGEGIPLDDLLRTVAQIVGATDIPVSLDFEAGFAGSAAEIAENTRGVLDTGVVGINLEDRLIGEERLRDPAEQAERIAAVRAAAKEGGVPFFINARTDLFLSEPDPCRHEALVAECLDRAKLYREAGASGLFVPGLMDLALISTITEGTPLPVNAMALGREADLRAMADAGVSRISRGPAPWREAMKDLAAWPGIGGLETP